MQQEKLITPGRWTVEFEEGKIVSAHYSDSYRKILGVESEKEFEEAMSNWGNHIHPEDRAAVEAMTMRVIEARHDAPEYDIEYRMRTKYGYRWVHDYAEIERNEDGTPIRARGVVFDITEQKRNTDYMSNVLEVINSSGMGIWRIHLKEGMAPTMLVSEKMAELLGIDNNALSDEEIYEAWHSRITPGALASVQASVQEMIDGQFSENTYLWNHPTLGDRYVRCGGKSIHEPDGTIVLSGYHYDVTDVVKKEMEQKRKEKKTVKKFEEMNMEINKLYGLVQGLNKEYHTIWSVDKDTQQMHLISLSGENAIKSAVQMGFDNPIYSQAAKLYVENYVEPEDRERLHKQLEVNEVLRQIELQNLYEINYLRRDDQGVKRYHQIAIANADTEDGSRQFVFGFRDIDNLIREEQKKQVILQEALDAANAANAAKTSFLFNMSHDIRTPMNAIIGFTKLLRKEQADNEEKREDYLNKIENSSNVLLSILNNVLEMSRIEKGHVEVIETKVNAHEMGKSIYNMFLDRMAAKNITFKAHSDIKHETVYCDENKVREILLNLMSNALKYTPEGGNVTFYAKELKHEKDGHLYIHFTIEDSGIGMSKEFIPHIFDEFAREHNTTYNKIEGTGLGMSIVKRLVDLLGGTIEVESELGKGSKFTLILPHRIADGIETEEEIIEETELTDRLQGRRILMAEDNDLNAEITIELLSEVGLLVERAEDGRQCIEMLEKAPNDYYDAILMDVQMPRMNGYEATATIRNMDDQEKANIPIFALTANAFEEDKRMAIDAGMNGHLGKPIDISEVLKCIGRVVVRG